MKTIPNNKVIENVFHFLLLPSNKDGSSTYSYKFKLLLSKLKNSKLNDFLVTDTGVKSTIISNFHFPFSYLMI